MKGVFLCIVPILCCNREEWCTIVPIVRLMMLIDTNLHAYACQLGGKQQAPVDMVNVEQLVRNNGHPLEDGDGGEERSRVGRAAGPSVFGC